MQKAARFLEGEVNCAAWSVQWPIEVAIQLLFEGLGRRHGEVNCARRVLSAGSSEFSSESGCTGIEGEVDCACETRGGYVRLGKCTTALTFCRFFMQRFGSERGLSGEGEVICAQLAF